MTVKRDKRLKESLQRISKVTVKPSAHEALALLPHDSGQKENNSNKIQQQRNSVSSNMFCQK
jgi:hypothetical protein